MKYLSLVVNGERIDIPLHPDADVKKISKDFSFVIEKEVKLKSWVWGIDESLTNRLKSGELLVGLSETDCKTLVE